eukprot:5960115-Amphidinium_carterae.1
MTCMTLLITTLLRSHFATNTVGLPEDYVGDAMDELREHPQLGVYRMTSRELSETTIEYVSNLPGDTPDDERRRQQIHYIDDDIESIVDEEYYDKKKRGEQARRSAEVPECFRGTKFKNERGQGQNRKQHLM